MEFKSLLNIESNFRQLRLYSLVFAGICTVITLIAVWKSYSFAEAQRQKIYVLDNGKSLLLALSQDLSQNRPVEAREHVRRFHELFFSLSPDKAAIESNINRALLMADKSALTYYKVLMEKGFFNRLIAGNISQIVKVRLRTLSLRGDDLRPAADHAREQYHRAQFGYDLPIGQLRAFRQQSAGVYAGELEHHRKQRPDDL